MKNQDLTQPELPFDTHDKSVLNTSKEHIIPFDPSMLKTNEDREEKHLKSYLQKLLEEVYEG